jgi:hypothetical protein
MLLISNHQFFARGLATNAGLVFPPLFIETGPRENLVFRFLGTSCRQAMDGKPITRHPLPKTISTRDRLEIIEMNTHHI